MPFLKHGHLTNESSFVNLHLAVATSARATTEIVSEVLGLPILLAAPKSRSAHE
jgi:hypothetical protein